MKTLTQSSVILSPSLQLTNLNVLIASSRTVLPVRVLKTKTFFTHTHTHIHTHTHTHNVILNHNNYPLMKEPLRILADENTCINSPDVAFFK